MSRKIDGNLIKSGPVPSLPLRRNHEKQSSIRGRKHMLYVVFPPRFNMFPFRFHLWNQVISSCEKSNEVEMDKNACSYFVSSLVQIEFILILHRCLLLAANFGQLVKQKTAL